MKALIEKLEAAAEGSRELDGDIADAIGYTKPRDVGFGFVGGPTRAAAPHYTTSIDAALTLVPAGWRVDIFAWDSMEAECYLRDRDGQHPACKWAECKWNLRIPALALCIAALKARTP